MARKKIKIDNGVAASVSLSPGFFDIIFGGNAMDLTVWGMIFLTSLATIALIVDAILSIRVAAVKF